MDFSLPLEAHGVSHNSRQQQQRHEEQSSPLSTALIIHPLSLYSNALSPTYGQEMLLSKINLQMQEMQQLYQQQQLAQQQLQQQQQVDAAITKKKSLLDFTCDENVRSILGYLDGASLSAAQRVNQYFRQLSGDDMYWYNLCKAEWAISPEQLKTRPASYQALYKYACKSLKRLIRDFFEEQCLSSMQKSFRIPRDTALMIARRSVSY